jgi:hypothetical protein
MVTMELSPAEVTLLSFLRSAGWIQSEGVRRVLEAQVVAPEPPTFVTETAPLVDIRSTLREVVLTRAKTPEGRADVQNLLAQFGVRRAGELTDEQARDFLNQLLGDAA